MNETESYTYEAERRGAKLDAIVRRGRKDAVREERKRCLAALKQALAETLSVNPGEGEESEWHDAAKSLYRRAVEAIRNKAKETP